MGSDQRAFQAGMGALGGVTKPLALYTSATCPLCTWMTSCGRLIWPLAAKAIGPYRLSNWLLAISLFLFLSLALVKRCAELEELDDEEAALAPGRGYQARDLASLRAMGLASGFLAVMVLTLYIDSQKGREQYAQPEWLWGAAPLLLLWIMRIWLKTGRRELHGEDPLQFALRDSFSWLTVALMGGVGLLATAGV